MYNIEQMPNKIKLRIKNDENGEQAFIGDQYKVQIILEPEDINITELSLEIVGLDSMPI